jgi:hypothetical protein
MGVCILGTMWMGKSRGMGCIDGRMGAGMKGSGLIIKLIRKESISGRM